MNHSPLKHSIIFISATDTGVGKTTVAGLLAAYLKKEGINCAYQKWLASGDQEVASDLRRVRELSGLTGDALRVDYLFPLPASPHLAAEEAGTEIEPARLLASSREFAARHDLLIIEGIGGLLVPINRKTLLIDLVAELAAPVLLMAKSGLGTINHTLLSLLALRQRQIDCMGVLFSDEAGSLDEKITADNLETIAALGKVQVIGRLGRKDTDRELVRGFAPLGAELLKIIRE